MPRDDNNMVRDAEEEWMLERITNHRMAKKVGTGVRLSTTATDDDYMEYQCEWRGYDEPTREPRSTLENDFIRELLAYESAIATKRAAANQPPPQAAAASAKSSHKKPSRSERARANAPPGLDEVSPFGNPQCISDLCGFDVTAPTTPERCPDNVIDYQAQVYGCGVCATDEQIATFMKLHEELQASHMPVIVYHGNELTHLPKICKDGFTVPKTEKDVGYTRNGMGIFASFKLLDCAEYCKSSDSDMRVLCCVALISSSDRYQTVIKRDSHVLFKRPELILPVWALDIALESYIGHASLLEHRTHSYASLGVPYPHTAKHKLKM